jgi:hypothetical protein
MGNTNKEGTKMTTTTEHQAVKVTYRKDRWGMARARWQYREVTIHYWQNTKGRKPWSAIIYTKTGWQKTIAATKAEMLQKVDDFIADGYAVDDTGHLISPWN